MAQGEITILGQQAVEREPKGRYLLPELEQQDAWLATVRRWLEQDRDAARDFNTFRTREKGGAA